MPSVQFKSYCNVRLMNVQYELFLNHMFLHNFISDQIGSLHVLLHLSLKAEIFVRITKTRNFLTYFELSYVYYPSVLLFFFKSILKIFSSSFGPYLRFCKVLYFYLNPSKTVIFETKTEVPKNSHFI